MPEAPVRAQISSIAYDKEPLRAYGFRDRAKPGETTQPQTPPIFEHGPVAMGDVGRCCGSCHLPSGRGRPENVPPGGLPVRYFTRQINDFREGLRYSADPRKPNTNTMMRSRRQ